MYLVFITVYVLQGSGFTVSHHPHQYFMFLLREIIKLTLSLDILHLFFLTSCPARLKTLSEETEDAGIAKYFFASLDSLEKKHFIGFPPL